MNPSEGSRATRVIETEIEIDAPVGAVWKALTDAEELTRWFPLSASVSPGKDGTIAMAWGQEYQAKAKIEIWEPNERLRMVFPLSGASREEDSSGESASSEPQLSDESIGRNSKGIPMIQEWTFETRAGKTLVRLVHSGFGAGEDWQDEIYEGTRRGWAFELRGLRHYLENHPGTRRDTVWVQMYHGLPTGEAWSRLMSPRGLLAQGSLADPVEGDGYDIVAATGDRFQGTVHVWNPPHDFAATVAGINDAFLRFRLDRYMDRPEANFWLSTYGVPRDRLATLETGWRSLMEDLFEK